MSISGMTGFGRAEGAWEALRWGFELKSVNGRALDVKGRFPPGFEGLEQALREGAQKRFRRGSIQAVLTVKREGPLASGAVLDLDFLEGLIAAGDDLIASGRVRPPRWDGLLLVRGAFRAGEAEEAVTPELLGRMSLTLEAALDALAHARRAEGEALRPLLLGLLDEADRLVLGASAEAAAAPAALRQRLLTRLSALDADLRLDPQRLAQEAALAASRADVREELDRLKAHIGEARALILSPEPAGRKLDFLCQELNREANTLCAKSSELALTRHGLDLKSAIDQFREQVANVE